ncbi:integrin-linked protein kinase 1-like protein isoform X2, partial [Tanacetum coccineum]
QFGDSRIRLEPNRRAANEFTWKFLIQTALPRVNLSYISGPIPQTLGNLVGLTTLNLAGNNFTGMIPESIGKLRKSVDITKGTFTIASWRGTKVAVKKLGDELFTNKDKVLNRRAFRDELELL